MKQNSQNKTINDHKGQKSVRCICGRLLARLVSGGVELKCRRCKRQVIVPLGVNRPAKDGESSVDSKFVF